MDHTLNRWIFNEHISLNVVNLPSSGTLANLICFSVQHHSSWLINDLKSLFTSNWKISGYRLRCMVTLLIENKDWSITCYEHLELITSILNLLWDQKEPDLIAVLAQRVGINLEELKDTSFTVSDLALINNYMHEIPVHPTLDDLMVNLDE